ncbi:hypothetical protein B4125_3444 [Bacillus paralicheniformis]|uniref:Uncharacterized protein n=1 Tax=Bacillus paralicheniformis TaxID=1648923 RepID=A0ABY3FQP7_9BACI|nr:hypothetical protein B4125_3444 [Bacillus paralicheniformis]TWJ60299.1 hypothetical protein CHCC5021_3488 [Bacillus paralicheniformis]TWK26238.1 hypothetical protein CHCC20372_1282 [Bacillus paralicheniformis]TWK38529.1 hypothetical protein CHCC20347_3788 [Bacillus paralicheniformis]TWK47919.1 hypothetical protein CHCC20348_3442 [Bacillus paralicheniformis]
MLTHPISLSALIFAVNLPLPKCLNHHIVREIETQYDVLSIF